MKLKYEIIKIGILGLKLIYMPIRKRRKKDKIVIISRQSKNRSLDIALLSGYLEKQHPEIELKVLVRFIDSGVLSKIAYAFHVLRQMNEIATAKVVVLDGYCIVASVLQHSNDTKIVQMWHSMAAIKRFGWQTIDKKGGHSRELAGIMCMHKNYDYVIAPSEITGRFFCEGFGCDYDKIQQFCLPRIDYIKQLCRNTKENDGKEINNIGINSTHEMILYAPTFRKNTGLKVKELFESIDFDRFELVVKPHPLFEEDFAGIIQEMGIEGNVIMGSEKSTFEWFAICDRVISDYSAIAIESLVTGKPLYFYVYDIDEYEEDTGLNVNPLHEVPTISAKSGTELKQLLDNQYDWTAYEKLSEMYLRADTEECTKKLAEFIIGVADGSIKKEY